LKKSLIKFFIYILIFYSKLHSKVVISNMNTIHFNILACCLNRHWNSLGLTNTNNWLPPSLRFKKIILSEILSGFDTAFCDHNMRQCKFNLPGFCFDFYHWLCTVIQLNRLDFHKWLWIPYFHPLLQLLCFQTPSLLSQNLRFRVDTF